MLKPYVIRKDHRDQIPMGEGVQFSYLRKVEEEYSILVQMESGKVFSTHSQSVGEELFVIDGDVIIGDFVLQAGDYYFSPQGKKESISTTHGCTVLISSTKGLESSPSIRKQRVKS
ncbi:cupin domain-containing protein [Hazenella coriacea]|uniref:ChrR-like protein with cupin domain n=1 Tax=Hazenella coriacea TaxID=1179467 RepID=A0A4V2UVA2_9BACL|nr:cupin domain-containing protein [Hazenella coriacea]TCS95027.1 ChrR-like protein with cupin domain [Hazenella coriacea]